jgi:hypothetical protein
MSNALIEFDIEFDHVVVVKNAAEELCYSNDFANALSHLDTGVCMMQILQNGLDPHVAEEIKDAVQNGLADILDDMACIEHKLQNYEAAIYYIQLRMNMLMWHNAKDKKEEEASWNWRALADAHSGMFALLRLYAVEQEAQGKLRCAIETLLLALKMLENCHKYKDNHVHIRETMLEVARILHAVGKTTKAQHFERRSRSVENKGSSETCLYNTKDKIFVRPLHGESPVLRYGNETSRAKVTTYKASKKAVSDVAIIRHQLQKFGITVQQEKHVYKSMMVRLESPAAGEKLLQADNICCIKYKEHQADLMMQQLLEEEEEEKAAQKKPSRKQRRAQIKAKEEASLQEIAEIVARFSAGGDTEAGAACGPVDASAAHVDDKSDIDDMLHFQCPLTLEVMKNPVVTVDGHSFEESAIRLWLQNHDTSPMTNKVLESKILIPNISLKAAIEAAGDVK